jgi:TonB family protein
MPGGTVTASPCGQCGASRSSDFSPGGLCPACLLGFAISDGAGDEIPEAGSVDELPTGTVFAHFLVRRLLGRGGMAAVYEALDTRLDRIVALKVLPSEFLHDRTFARRFENEARLIASLEHPNIVPIYEAGIEAGVPWMSMRLLRGGTLGTLLERGRLPSADVVRLLRQVAGALDHAHAVGVVHRDVKPANILLDAAGAASVADFGLAQLMERDAGLTQTGMLTGTPHYMAPEQALGKRVDHRCDIYSLGIVAYEMFVGTPPFGGDSPISVLMRHVHEPLPVPAGPLSDARWIESVEKAAAKDPADRWPSANAFVEALESGLVAAPALATQDERLLPWASPRRVAVAAGIVLSAATLFWLLVQEPGDLPAEPQPAVATAPKEAAASQPDALQTPIPDKADSPAPPSRTRRAPSSTADSVSATGEKSRTLRPEPSDEAVNTVPTVPSAEPPASLPGSPLPIEPFTSKPPAPNPPPPPALIEPEPISKFGLEYPQAAKAAELEGTVVLVGVVGVDGRVSNISVERSVHKLLDDAARKTWLQYRYKPAHRNGVPEPRPLRMEFQFVLKFE